MTVNTTLATQRREIPRPVLGIGAIAIILIAAPDSWGFLEALYFGGLIYFGVFLLFFSRTTAGNKIVAAVQMLFGWTLLMIPLWIIGSFFGAVADNPIPTSGTPPSVQETLQP